MREFPWVDPAHLSSSYIIRPPNTTSDRLTFRSKKWFLWDNAMHVSLHLLKAFSPWVLEFPVIHSLAATSENWIQTQLKVFDSVFAFQVNPFMSKFFANIEHSPLLPETSIPPLERVPIRDFRSSNEFALRIVVQRVKLSGCQSEKYQSSKVREWNTIWFRLQRDLVVL